MVELPTSPAELSALLRHVADMLDELHARREGTWEAQAKPMPIPDETIPFASEPRGSPLTRRALLLRQVLDEAGPDVLSRGGVDERALISAGLLEIVLCDFDDCIARNCLTSSAALEAMVEPDVYALAAGTLGHKPDEPPSTVRTEPPCGPGPPEKHPLDALIESLGGPLPDDVGPPSAGTLAAILADEPEPEDLTATQTKLLRFIYDRPRGFLRAGLPGMVDAITGQVPTESVLQVYRAALGVLLERGLAKKVETKRGALILARDAPEPEEDVPLPEAAAPAPEPHRPRRVPYDPRLVRTEDGGQGCIVEGPPPIDRVLDDLRAHPRSTVREIRARLKIQGVRTAIAELVRAGLVTGEGKTRGRRYWVT